VALRARAAYAQLFVSISVAQAHKRNESRDKNDVVPRDALERMADQFEPPAAEVYRDDDGEAGAEDDASENVRAVRAFERDATVTVAAERLGFTPAGVNASDVNDVWLRVREKWTRPATLVGLSSEALEDRRRLGSRARARAAANDAFAGMTKQARGALSGALNDARREMVDAVRAAAKANAAAKIQIKTTARDGEDDLREGDGDVGGASGDEDGDDADDRDAELEFVAEMNARESRFAALCREMLSGERGR
jgi:hypothetical protein